jgi:sugar (pentulose or hexulose) kinase
VNTADPQYFLSIDNGTQSVRAMVFDQAGELIAKSKVDIEPYQSPAPGLCEIQPEYVWRSLCEACQKLWPMLDFPREQISAASVTTQRATVVPVDKEGRALHPSISWLDQRKVDSSPRLSPLYQLLTWMVGARGAVADFHANAEANWYAEKCPEVWKRVDKYLLLSGYHVYRLTGNFSDAVSSQVGYLPFDFRRQCWAASGEWKWRTLPLSRAMLPELHAAGSLLGPVSAAGSQQTGIPAGTPLIASGSDKACEVLGSGCLSAGTGSLSYGTTATFNITTDRYMEIERFHPAYPGVVAGSFNPEVAIRRGFWLVSWFKNEFGLREQRLAQERGVSPESLFDDLLEAVPPGSDGLLLQPYWSADACPAGPEARGAIIGFNDVHTRAHIYRALIEGIAYALREGKGRLEKRSGQAISTLKVSGGGSQSDQVMQITADIFGMEVERPHTFETSGLGAAIAAAVGTNTYPDFKTAVDHMTRVGDRFAPDQAHRQIYDRLYSDVYQKIYRGLKPSYQAIQDIVRASA